MLAKGWGAGAGPRLSTSSDGWRGSKPPDVLPSPWPAAPRPPQVRTVLGEMGVDCGRRHIGSSASRQELPDKRLLSACCMPAGAATETPWRARPRGLGPRICIRPRDQGLRPSLALGAHCQRVTTSPSAAEVGFRTRCRAVRSCPLHGQPCHVGSASSPV